MIVQYVVNAPVGGSGILMVPKQTVERECIPVKMAVMIISLHMPVTQVQTLQPICMPR